MRHLHLVVTQPCVSSPCVGSGGAVGGPGCGFGGPVGGFLLNSLSSGFAALLV